MVGVRHIVVLFVLFGGNLFLYGQEMLSYVRDGQVHLRWAPASDDGLEGYNLYRKNGSADWVKVNEKTITWLSKRKQIDKELGYLSNLYLGLFGLEEDAKELTPEQYNNTLSDEASASFIGAISVVNVKIGEALGVVYTDDQPGDQTIQYRVDKIVSGTSTVHANSGEISVQEAKAIRIPRVFKGSADHEAANLSWYKDEDAMTKGEIVSYNVYRSTSLLGPFQRINPTGILPLNISSGKNKADLTVQTYRDDFLTNNITYYYQVRNVNAFGFESKPSITIEITPKDNRTPASPQQLNIQPFGKAIQLTWSCPDTAGFVVYKKVDGSNGFTKVAPEADFLTLTETNWIDYEAKRGNAYYYFVNSVAADGETTSSSDTFRFDYLDDRAPEPPSNVVAKVENGTILLSWDPSSSNNVVGYDIERAADDAFKTRYSLNSEVITKNEFKDDPDDISSRTYGYLVYAVNEFGMRSEAAEMIKAHLPDILPPSSPIITYLMQEEDYIRVKWTKSSSDVVNYILECRKAGGKAFVPCKETAVTETNTHPGSDGKMEYRVIAVDSAGNQSEPGNAVSTIFRNASQLMPPINGRAKLDSANDIVITWETQKGSNASGFIIFREDQSSGNIIVLAEVENDIHSFVDEFGEPQTRYEYRIKSFDKYGRESAPLSIQYKPKRK